MLLVQDAITFYADVPGLLKSDLKVRCLPSWCGGACLLHTLPCPLLARLALGGGLTLGHLPVADQDQPAGAHADRQRRAGQA